MVQAEGRRDRRLRDHRRRSGLRAPQPMALQLPSGGPRRRHVRGRRQDVQGIHRCAIRRDDRAALGARGGRRRLYRAGAAGGRRRGRLQRDPEEPDLPLRHGAPVRPDHADPRRQVAGPGHDARGAARALRAAIRDQGPHGVESAPVTTRVSTGIPKLDAMLDGGLLPGTLTVAYGATGIGKTHLGLAFAHHGRRQDGAPGLLFDMNARGDSQQHLEYAARLYGWRLGRWTHAVTPMADPYPPEGQTEAFYCDAFPWIGRLRDYQVSAGDGVEFDWNWKAMYNHALYTVRPFVYFHMAAGSRRVVVDGIEPMDV